MKWELSNFEDVGAYISVYLIPQDGRAAGQIRVNHPPAITTIPLTIKSEVTTVRGIILPTVMQPGKYKLRVFCQSNNPQGYTSCSDESDNMFSIKSPNDTADPNIDTTELPSVTILSPNGGQTLTAGNIVHISWTSANVFNVANIQLIENNGSVVQGITNIYNTGSYNWQIPSGLVGSNFKIRISVGSVVDESDSSFSIISPSIYNSSSQNVQVTPSGGGQSVSAPIPTPVSKPEPSPSTAPAPSTDQSSTISIRSQLGNVLESIRAFLEKIDW